MSHTRKGVALFLRLKQKGEALPLLLKFLSLSAVELSEVFFV